MRNRPRILLNALKLAEGRDRHLAGNYFHVQHLSRELAESGEIDLTVLTDEFSREPLIKSGLACKIAYSPLSSGGVLAADRIVAKWVHRLKPDIYHRPTGQLPFARLRCRTVGGIADLNFRTLPTPIYKRLYKEVSYRWTLKVADCVSCVSEFTKNEAINKLGASAEKLRVIHHGANILPKADYRVADQFRNRYWLSFGHQAHKNVETSIRALTMRRNHASEDIVVIGNSKYIDQILRPMVVQAGLDRCVHFVGRISEAALRGLYERALGLVFLSRFEGFGMPLLEAMACGCPVISSNLCSLPEVAGDAAILVDPFDAVLVREAMARLSCDGALRSDIIARGRRRASLFTWRSAAAKTLGIYMDILSNPNAGHFRS